MMLNKNRLFVLLVLFVLLMFLTACGGSSTKLAPPPSGSFSNANFSGTYAFSVSGTNQFGLLLLAGSIQADGNGNISSGVLDVNSGSGVSTNLPISGTYSVSADGRGVASITAPAINSIFTVDFVIVSSSRALAIRFDPNSSASGSFDKQDSNAFSSGAITGQYALSLSGIGANGGAYQSAGLFAADGNGGLSNGLLDTNNDGTVTVAVPLSGTYSVGASSGRGTISLTTSSGVLNFVFYVVDATHLKLIETDGAPVLSGDVFRQSGTFGNASVSGPFAFTVGGGLVNPFVAGGVFTSDGNGNIAAGAEDLNNGGGIVQNVPTTGTYSIASTGRGTMTFNNSSGTFNFAVYPSTGGLLMMEMDSSLPSLGVAYAQTGTPSAAAISGNYGFNLTGVDPASSLEVDSVARISSDGNGQFTGALDLNLFGGLSQRLAFNGPYSIGSNGRGTATLKSSAGTQSFALYFVSSSRVLFVETDAGLVGVGTFEQQQ